MPNALPRRYSAFPLLLLVLASVNNPAVARPSAPANVRVTYAEQSLEIHWDSVPGAKGYNVYTSSTANAPRAKRTKVNALLIRSGTRFTYLWNMKNGQRVRQIKGYRHHLSVTAVAEERNRSVESDFSAEADNDYFQRFDRMSDVARLRTALRPSQRAALLPLPPHVNAASDFVPFMHGPGSRLYSLLRDSIDFREKGSCAPVSTVAVMLMQAWDLYAYKVEGLFIKEFHSFVVINVDSVEYVVDFTADQFVPDVSPVVVPRDYCFLNDRGKLDTAGTPVYQIGRVFAPEQCALSEKESSRLYHSIYAAVAAAKLTPIREAPATEPQNGAPQSP